MPSPEDSNPRFVLPLTPDAATHCEKIGYSILNPGFLPSNPYDCNDPAFQRVLDQCKPNSAPHVNLNVFADRGLSGMEWYLCVSDNFADFYTLDVCMTEELRVEHMLGLLWLSINHPTKNIIRGHSISWLHVLQDVVLGEAVVRPTAEFTAKTQQNTILEDWEVPDHHHNHGEDGFYYRHQEKQDSEDGAHDNTFSGQIISSSRREDIDYYDPRCLQCIEDKIWCSRTAFDGSRRCHRCPPGVACVPEEEKAWKNGQRPIYGVKKSVDPTKASVSH